MEQRPLRLGDILDDYCPRERRVTNHAIVAMIDESVKQTRCTTCDAEHAYKGGREPRRRRKETTSVLYRDVLATLPEAQPSVVEPPAPVALAAPVDAEPPVNGNGNGESADAASNEVDVLPGADEPADAPVANVEEGPIHRRLIRATLPRPEGQKDVRQVPDFTIRGNGNRPHGQFRGDRTRGQGGSSGMRAGARRFGAGSHQGGAGARNGRGGRQGFGSGGNQRHGGGRKRSR